MRQTLRAIDVPELRFRAPVPDRHEVLGVPVFHLHDPTLPLVTFQARVRGGYGRFDREDYVAVSALPELLRTGGTASLPPDSVEALIEGLALQTTFGGGSETLSASMNALAEHWPDALSLWGEMLTRPRFDRERVTRWRSREAERVRRASDQPAALAVKTFNALLYGDHPIGWDLEPADFRPGALSPARLERVHARLACRDNLVLGVSGDAAWATVAPALERMIASFPPCRTPLPPAPRPVVRTGGGVFLLPRPVVQSTVIMGHASDIRRADDPRYFASRIANALLGSGGLDSRMMRRLRTRTGLAYSAGTVWTTPRGHPGLVVGITHSGRATTADATREMLAVFRDVLDHPPGAEEVAAAVDEALAGFVFGFDTPRSIVARRMAYELDGTPPDWTERYVEGVRRVDPEAVAEVLRATLRPGVMTILVVGDPSLEDRLRAFGEVTVLEGR